jgi:transcriptional regulator with GAF, ATPase, and Fis domain
MTISATSDDQSDLHFEIPLLLEIAQERSLEQLFKKLSARIMERAEVARFRIWIIDRGDLCSTCPFRPQCPDQSRCLHAVAGAIHLPGSPPIVEDHATLIDAFSRVPLGLGVVGEIATDGKIRIYQDLDKDPRDLAHCEWITTERIRGYHGLPIIYKGDVLGVISVYTRENIPEKHQIWGRIFADHIAGSIANARAFEENQRLRALLEKQNSYLKEEIIEAKAFGTLIGQSAVLRHIVSQIDLVAPTEASVLILGETGTGKELVAHEIHRRSKRGDEALVRVNCASIPKELFESEFFGHAKGSFTGAIKDRAGRFEAAEGGTLFLDEVGEIPYELQGKLLRALQEKRYERVGEERTRLADIRVIAATNRNLKKEVAAGRFREDLFYRLNVFPIQVAPLSERRDDIPLLAQHFVNLSAKEMGCPRPRLTRAGIIQLQGYDWPGNIREMRNVIERAVILVHGGVLEFDLPSNEVPAPITQAAEAKTAHTGDAPLTESELQQRERQNLVAVLERTDWKIKGENGAAEYLGVKPATLLSRIKKWGLKRAEAKVKG